MKFVQQLSKKFPNEVSGLIGNYVNNYQAEYESNRDQNWNKKASLLNLLITGSISTYTYRNGASEINIPADTLFMYIQQLVIPEL